METARSTDSQAPAIERLAGSISNWAIYLLFFLVPLFFLPWTTTLLEINKQILFVILTAIAVVAWLGGMVSKKSLVFRRSWLNLIPLLLLIGVFVSSLYSLAGFQTWVGVAAQEYTSFLSTAMFILFFYVLMHSAGQTATQRKTIFALLISATVAGVVTLLGMMNWVHLPFAFAQGTGFNTVGTLIGFATFLTVVMFLGLAMMLVANGKNKIIPAGAPGVIFRILVVLVGLMNIFTILVVDFWVLWAINLVGAIAMVGFVFIQTKEFPQPRRFIFPFLILILSVIFIFFNSPVARHFQIPTIISPSYGMSWEITTKTITQDFQKFLFGSGPGTFAFDYAKFRPVDVNQTQLFETRFDRGKSHAMTSLATTGFIGLGLCVALVLFLLIKAFSLLIRERDKEEWKMTYVLLIGWLVITSAHLLYSSNFTLHFIFWGLSGLLAAQVVKGVYQSNFTSSPRAGLLSSFAFVVLAVATVAAIFVSGQRYAAEITFANAVQLDRAGAPLNEIIVEVARAAELNPLSDEYQRNLSSALLLQGVKVLSEAGAEPTEEQISQVQSLVLASVNSATRASQIEPNNVLNWTARGAIYRDLMNFAQDAETAAIEMYKKAEELEPNNPTHSANLGRVYLSVAERAGALKGVEDEEFAAKATEQETQMLMFAEEALRRSIDLKGDYAPAHYYLAIVSERQGNLEDAASRIGALRQLAPNDIGLGFQYAMLLIRLEEYQFAGAELERLLMINPEYSNAMWFLAAIHEKLGNREVAIALMEKVKELNPENQLVDQTLQQLKTGAGPIEIQGPVEDGAVSATDVQEGEIVEEPVPEVLPAQ